MNWQAARHSNRSTCAWSRRRSSGTSLSPSPSLRRRERTTRNRSLDLPLHRRVGARRSRLGARDTARLDRSAPVGALRSGKPCGAASRRRDRLRPGVLASGQHAGGPGARIRLGLVGGRRGQLPPGGRDHRASPPPLLQAYTRGLGLTSVVGRHRVIAACANCADAERAGRKHTFGGRAVGVGPTALSTRSHPAASRCKCAWWEVLLSTKHTTAYVPAGTSPDSGPLAPASTPERPRRA